MTFKALFFAALKPYSDMGDLLQVARVEACKIMHCDKVKVLNILFCPYPFGYVVVVQNPGGKEKKRIKGED